MRPLTRAFAICMTMGLGISATFQDKEELDTILKKYFETMGYEKMEDIETIVMKGKVDRGGMKMPLKLIKKRPEMVRQEFKFQGNQYVSAYDGEDGWAIRPGMSASKKAQDLTGERLENLKERASFEGQLYHHEEKGYDVSLVGEEKMEGTPVYHLKMEKDEDETVHYYIDKSSYVLLKEKTKKMKEDGKERVSTAKYSNYKRVDGIPFSFVMESGSGQNEGQGGAKIVIENIELDKEVPDEKFERPGKGEENKKAEN